jgi:hypothetical protein
MDAVSRLPIELNFWVIPPLGLKVNLLFAGICFLGGLLSLDKAFASVAIDPGLALRISRIDHLFVVFFIPVYLHFIHTFLHIARRKWLVGLAYCFSACLSLFSQGDHYLTGVKQYFFGYYATGGPLMYVFGAASAINVVDVCIRGCQRHKCRQVPLSF